MAKKNETKGYKVIKESEFDIPINQSELPVEGDEQPESKVEEVGKEDLVERLLGKCPGCKKKD